MVDYLSWGRFWRYIWRIICVCFGSDRNCFDDMRCSLWESNLEMDCEWCFGITFDRINFRIEREIENYYEVKVSNFIVTQNSWILQLKFSHETDQKHPFEVWMYFFPKNNNTYYIMKWLRMKKLDFLHSKMILMDRIKLLLQFVETFRSLYENLNQ